MTDRLVPSVRLRLVVDAIDDEIAGIRTLTLVAPDRSVLPSFAPGSHVVIDAGPVRNAYSLTGPWNSPTFYRVSVALQNDGSGGSLWLHRNVAIGSVLSVSPPRSLFSPVVRSRKSLFIAGGIGITPIVSHAARAAKAGIPFDVFYVAHRNRRAYENELRVLCNEDRAGGKRSLTVVEHRGELLDAVERRSDCQPIGTDAFLCGPAAMMTAVRSCLATHHWPAERVHEERFVAAELGPGAPFVVELARQKHQTVSVPSGVSLLDALQEAGTPVPHMCRQGVCGECKVPVLDGDVVHRDIYLDDDEKKENTAMMCCVSRGRGTVVVDL